MQPLLGAIKQPLAIRTEHIVNEPTTFRVSQHGKLFHSGHYDVFDPRDKSKTPLISVKGTGTSAKERRYFRDASGRPLFELQHKIAGCTWYVSLPGRGRDHWIMRIAPQASMYKDVLDITLRNAAQGGREVFLKVRGESIWKTRTNVYCGDQIVMTSNRTSKWNTYLPGKTEWDVNVVEGMDVSLAAAIMVVLGSTMYNSSMQQSWSDRGNAEEKAMEKMR